MEATNTFISKQIAYWEGDKKYHFTRLKEREEQLDQLNSLDGLEEIKRENINMIAHYQEELGKANMHLDILYTARDAKADNLYRKI